MAKRHGLIEANGNISTTTSQELLSVAKRHGLIEARLRMVITRVFPTLSVAKRHGLIEAKNFIRAIFSFIFVIRGKTPRPH